MAGGLVALLDDVAALAKAAAASLDDVGVAATRASVKATGVVVDDTAVTPRYVQGLEPARELPIIKQIAIGSLRNKIVLILPAIMLLSQFLPGAVMPLLMVGGAYLSYEGAEKLWEALRGGGHAQDDNAGKSEDEITAVRPPPRIARARDRAAERAAQRSPARRSRGRHWTGEMATT